MQNETSAPTPIAPSRDNDSEPPGERLIDATQTPSDSSAAPSSERANNPLTSNGETPQSTETRISIPNAETHSTIPKTSSTNRYFLWLAKNFILLAILGTVISSIYDSFTNYDGLNDIAEEDGDPVSDSIDLTGFFERLTVAIIYMAFSLALTYPPTRDGLKILTAKNPREWLNMYKALEPHEKRKVETCVVLSINSGVLDAIGCYFFGVDFFEDARLDSRAGQIIPLIVACFVLPTTIVSECYSMLVALFAPNDNPNLRWYQKVLALFNAQEPIENRKLHYLAKIAAWLFCTAGLDGITIENFSGLIYISPNKDHALKWALLSYASTRSLTDFFLTGKSAHNSVYQFFHRLTKGSITKKEAALFTLSTATTLIGIALAQRALTHSLARDDSEDALPVMPSSFVANVFAVRYSGYISASMIGEFIHIYDSLFSHLYKKGHDIYTNYRLKRQMPVTAVSDEKISAQVTILPGPQDTPSEPKQNFLLSIKNSLFNPKKQTNEDKDRDQSASVVIPLPTRSDDDGTTQSKSCCNALMQRLKITSI